MKYLGAVLALFFSITSFAQKIEKREISSFDKIEVTGNIRVEMYQGEKELIEIKGINVDPSELVAEVKDKLLKVKMKSNLFEDEAQVKIKLTYKVIREITSNASAEVVVKDKIIGDKVFAEATSGGRIIMEVELNTIELKTYQGAHIDVQGKAKTQESYVNTGGVLAASKLECDEVFIRMNTKGNAEIVANNKIEATVNTGANLSFFGKPKEESLKTSLGGKITKWDED